MQEFMEQRVLKSALLEGTPGGEVLIAPWGVVRSTNGEFVVDEEGARLAVKAFEDHGTDLPIDYEHQTLGGSYASPNGQAPAAGWVKRIIARIGEGLFAHIEWTQSALKQLAEKEYRYLSPVALVRKSDRRLVGIHSAALTNKPAIVGMTPIINADRSAVTWEEPIAALRREAGLGDEASTEEILIAASRRLAELEELHRRQRAEDRIAEALRSGRLVEAQRQWAEELICRDETLFDLFLRTAPVVIQPGRVQPPPKEFGHNSTEHHVRRARSEFQSHPFLQRLTTEEAYVAMAASQVGP